MNETQYYTLTFSRQKWIDDVSMDNSEWTYDKRVSAEWAIDIDGKPITRINNGQLYVDTNKGSCQVNIVWCNKHPVYKRTFGVLEGGKNG